MTIEEQAAQVIALANSTRFDLDTLIQLYMVQESPDLATDRIQFLSQGKVEPKLILAEVDRAVSQLEEAAHFAFFFRLKNLKNAIAEAGGYERLTRFTRAIRGHRNAIEAMAKALDFISRIPDLADPVLYTDEVKANLAERLARLERYQAQLKARLVELEAWHESALQLGGFHFTEGLPAPSFAPGGYVNGLNGLDTDEVFIEEARALFNADQLLENVHQIDQLISATIPPTPPQ